MTMPPFEAPPLTWFQRFVLRVCGRVRIGWLKGPGWRAWLPAIAFVCERHGVVVDYEHGYESVLVCPLCQSEEASLDAGKSGGLSR